MSKLTPEARDFLDEARADERPPHQARDRVRARVLARAGAAAGAGAAAALVASETKAAAALAAADAAGVAGAGVKAAVSTGLLLKWIAVVGVAGTMAVGAGYLSERASQGPAAAPAGIVAPVSTSVALARPAPPPREDAPPAAAPSVEPRPAASATAPVATPRRGAAPASTPAPADSGLEAETGLLLRAQEEIRAGRAGSALQALEEHDADFKNGVLHEERRAEHILALCALGRTDEARAEAKRFLAAFPRSPMAERVRTSCGGDASH